MKTFRFSVPSGLHTFISFAFFALLSFGTQSQTISGHVYDACTGAPLGGATVNINVNLPGSPLGNWNIDTYPDGSWNFTFFGGDPVGPYLITVKGGDSSPNSYTYYTSSGNMSGFDFDLLPNVLDVTINGEEISWQNNPLSPHTVCKNGDNCLGLGEFAEVKSYCFKVSLYKTNKYGNKVSLLAESDCINFGRPNIGNPCGDPNIDLNGLLNKIEGVPKGSILMEVQQFCCESGCVVTDGTLVNTEVVFIEVRDIGPAQACFKFEDPNGVDLIEPGTDCQNAVAYCQVGVDVDGTCSSGAIDHYWIEVSEYDLNTCEFIRVLADGSSNPTTIGSLAELDGINLNNYVRDHWVADPNPQWPYFFLATNPPRNFEVTLFVENACGAYSQTGWFNNSIQCLTGGGNGQNNLIAPPTSNSGLAIIDDNIELLIYPNPVSDISNLRFQLREEEEVFIEVKSISGEILKKVEVGVLPKGINEFSMDFSGLPSGSYTLTVRAGDDAKVVKIAKI